MHERRVDDAAAPPPNEDHIIHLSDQESDQLFDLLRNPPEPTAALASFEEARRDGHFKLIT